MHPYRDAPISVASAPRSRTVIARLRSWNRRRKIRWHGTFRSRYHRCPECKELNRDIDYVALQMFPGVNCCPHAVYKFVPSGDTVGYCKFDGFNL